MPPWYAGQCPLIDGDAVILAPGGDPLMMAVELATGRILWRTPNPAAGRLGHDAFLHHADGLPGQRQYIYCTTDGVVGVSAGDGKMLWRKPDWKIALAMVPSPLVIDGERVFFSGGYNNGSVMVRIKGDGDRTRDGGTFPPEVHRLRRRPADADPLRRAHLRHYAARTNWPASTSTATVSGAARRGVSASGRSSWRTACCSR